MKITIKRVTVHGVEHGEGELFDHEGFQFCLMYDSFADVWHGIELSTGGAATGIYNDNATKRRAIPILKKNIQSRTKQQIEVAIMQYLDEYKRLYKKFKLKFPVNERVEND